MQPYPSFEMMDTRADCLKLQAAKRAHGDAWIDLIQAQLKLKLAEQKLEKIKKERRTR